MYSCYLIRRTFPQRGTLFLRPHSESLWNQLLSEVNLRRRLVPPSTTTLSLKVTIWLDSTLTSNSKVSIIHTGGYRFVSPNIVDGFASNITRFKHDIVPSRVRWIIIRLLYVLYRRKFKIWFLVLLRKILIKTLMKDNLSVFILVR